MQKYTKFVKIYKNHPRHLYKFLLPLFRVLLPAGCNFHYLPPALRLRFLESLQAYQTAANLKTRTKFDVSYDQLKGNRYTKPTIKKYLYSQAQSQFLRININEAALAVLLPVAQFRKESNRTVYKDSRAML